MWCRSGRWTRKWLSRRHQRYIRRLIIKKRILTQKQMYGYLYQGALDFKKANSKKPQDTINRESNIYAVKNTVKFWREQFKIKD